MSSAERYLNDFLSESEDLKATLTDAANSHLRPSTVDTVVELVLLRSFSVTEQLFREIFYSCMLGDESIPGSGGVVRVSQREHADLLLLATAERESAYVSWLPAKRVLDAAKRYLQPSNPFERIRYRDVELGALQDLTTIRNAVAHPDSDAMGRFSRLAAQRGYPHIRPASYLLSKRAGELEIRLIIARLERIARGLTAATEHEGATFLEAERTFSSGSAAPAGLFSCTRCEGRLDFPIPGKLPTCDECPAPVKCEVCGHARKPASTWQRQISEPTQSSS